MKKNLLLALFSLLLVLGIAEGVLRLVGVNRVKFKEKPRSEWVNVPENVWVEHHPVLGWYSQKNKTTLLKSTNFASVEIHTNSSGFRGTREYAKDKPQGVIRIAALGDSFVFGFGVGDSDAFPALLESSNQSREVMNLGIPGYGMDQIFLSYREVARNYRPNIVLIGVFPEDFWRCTRSFADSGHIKPYFSLTPRGKLVLHNVPVPPPFTLTSNQYPTLLEPNALERILNPSVLYQLAKKPLIKLAKNMRLIDPESSEEWLVGRAILEALIHEIRQDGAVPILVLMPPHNWAQSTRKTSLERSLIRFADREKVGFINLKPSFNEAVAKDGLETYYIPGDWHWTPKGHRLAAQTIEDFFNRRGA